MFRTGLEWLPSVSVTRLVGMSAQLALIALWAVGMCLLVGAGAEAFQLLFPVRHAAVGDVLLNAASGTLAAAMASRCDFSSGLLRTDPRGGCGGRTGRANHGAAVPAHPGRPLPVAPARTGR